MKKILHFLLISFFSFTIVSCAQINTLKDDLGSKYDELSSGSDETVDTDASGVPTSVAILSPGAGYNAADTDTVGLDGFPDSEITVTV